MATDNDLAFDTARCDIEPVARIPACENMLVNPNVSDAPPSVADTGPQLDEPLDSGGDQGDGLFTCPTIEPTVLTASPLTKITSGTPSIYYQFTQGDDCSYELEIYGEYLDPFSTLPPGFGSSFSFSESCVRLGPTDPVTVYLDEIPEDEDQTPSITYRFIRLPGCAYDLEITGTYAGGLDVSQTVITDLYCEGGQIYGVPVVMVFENGLLKRVDT